MPASSHELPTRRFTADEVLRMVDAGILDESEPLELLNGALVIVSPQGPSHSYATNVVRNRLLAAYRNGYIVREAKPIVAGVDGLPEPDVAVVRGLERDFAKRHPRGDEAVLVVEVAQSSLVIDRSKAAIYARAAVPVYWLLDLNSRRLEIHTEPHPDGRYALVHVIAEEEEAPIPETDQRARVAELLP